MATLRAASGLSARLLRQTAVRANDAHIVRGFTTSTRCQAAQNFTMPALSPTMTEGNIASWRVGEGDSFVAGDVLLEIETDKATMDVEAQEDGIMMKIVQGDGAKSIQVGTRIAVLAEAGDDIKALELPPDESASKPEPAKAESAQSESSGQQQQPTAEEKQAKRAAGGNASDKKHEQKYPLMPSVASLIHHNGLDEATVSTITPTGPGGRLLKGDVLAYLGTIDAKKPASVSAFLDKLSRLDLSNIKLAKKPAPQKDDKKAAKTEEKPAAPAFETISREISLEDVNRLRQVVERRLRTEVPIEVLIKRAIAIANSELPAAAVARDPFDEILGIAPTKPATTTTAGSFVPLINSNRRPEPQSGKSSITPDIIDILTGRTPQSGLRQPPKVSVVAVAGPAPVTTFELKVKPAEVKRAQAFFSRLEDVLTNQPGSLLVTQ